MPLQSVWESCVEKNLISFCNNMRDKRKVEILMKAVERVYNKNPDTQKCIDGSMIHVCKEGVSP